MGKLSKLSDKEISKALEGLDGWKLKDGKLLRVFLFEDFIQAWGFMTKVALIAQSMNHHPEWLNIYDTVSVELSTHDAGGVTELDVELAGRMNELIN